MRYPAFNLDSALIDYPDDEIQIRQAAEEIKQYSRECGCAMGSKFMIASIAIAGIYFGFIHRIALPRSITEILWGLLFVFTASAFGKMVGIGVAKLRLAMLYRSLRIRYPSSGE